MVSLLIVVIVTAIVFDFINGFHDAANAIATVVSTGVLPVRTAVLMAGLFNFIGAITGTAVAKTIASGFADPAIVVQTVVLAALLLRRAPLAGVRLGQCWLTCAAFALLLAACSGPYLMMAGTAVGSADYQLLAAAPRADHRAVAA